MKKHQTNWSVLVILCLVAAVLCFFTPDADFMNEKLRSFFEPIGLIFFVLATIFMFFGWIRHMDETAEE